jgi:hypothetical protein
MIEQTRFGIVFDGYNWIRQGSFVPNIENEIENNDQKLVLYSYTCVDILHQDRWIDKNFVGKSVSSSSLVYIYRELFNANTLRSNTVNDDVSIWNT